MGKGKNKRGRNKKSSKKLDKNETREENFVLVNQPAIFNTIQSIQENKLNVPWGSTHFMDLSLQINSEERSSIDKNEIVNWVNSITSSSTSSENVPKLSIPPSKVRKCGLLISVILLKLSSLFCQTNYV